MQEEDSNSLNGKIFSLDSNTLETVVNIRSIESLKGAKRGQVSIMLSDGSFFYLLKDILFKLGLCRGTELTYRKIVQLITESGQLEIKHKALELVAAVRHSRTGLHLKLLKKGYTPAWIDSVIDELVVLGYLDDEAYAKEWIQFRIRKHPEGKQALIAGLQKKGIEHVLAERCVREILTPANELNNVICLIEKFTRFRPLEEQKLMAKLRTRGFSYEVIKKAIKQRAQTEL